MKYTEYFDTWKVRPEYAKEFICIFNGWLGKDNLHKLDEVGAVEWNKYNALILKLSENYQIQLANIDTQEIVEINELNGVLTPYEEYIETESFKHYIFPELDCILAQDWDFTWILWHKNNGALEAIAPIIKKVGLYNFHS